MALECDLVAVTGYIIQHCSVLYYTMKFVAVLTTVSVFLKRLRRLFNFFLLRPLHLFLGVPVKLQLSLGFLLNSC